MITMTAQITTAQGGFIFTGQNATQAIASVRAHKMIDALGLKEEAEGEPVRTQIPYTSVLAADFYTEQTESEIEDDNCKVRTPEEQTKLILQNIDESAALYAITLTLPDTSVNGTYSGVTFTDGVATIPAYTIRAGASMTIVGLPEGNVSAKVGSAPPYTGTIPGTLRLRNPST